MLVGSAISVMIHVGHAITAALRDFTFDTILSKFDSTQETWDQTEV